MSCGIYKIENLLNHKKYIGQSIDIETRFYKHKSAKDNFHIHRAIQKYGKENFSFEIIEECEIFQLNEKERYWINYYNSLEPNGYNMIPGGSNGAGIAKGIPVEQYSLNGQYIQEFPSANRAGQITGINARNITSCCNQLRQQAGLFQWKWKNDKKIISSIEGVYKNDTILQYDLEGNFIKEWNSLQEIQKSLNISKSSLCSNLKGKTHSSKNFQWKYKHSNKEIKKCQKYKKTSSYLNKAHGGVYQYDKNNNLIAYYETATDAKKATGISNSDIGQVCKGKRKTAGGFIWRFGDDVNNI